MVLAGHRTSISLEAEFWLALRDVARARGSSVNALVAAIDAGRGAAPAGQSVERLARFHPRLLPARRNAGGAAY